MLLFCVLIVSCSAPTKKSKPNQNSLLDEILNIDTLTIEQQSALDALTFIQVNTDEPNQLYCTFSNIEHPCYPADTIFDISQSEFLKIMEAFLNKHCTNFTIQKRKELAGLSIQAQEKYQVLHCYDYSNKLSYDGGPQTSGTWILPNIRGRIDLTLVW